MPGGKLTWGVSLKRPEETEADGMIAIVFSILVLVAVLSVCSNIVIRVRLTTADPTGDRLVWWRRSSDEASRMYEQLFPGSYLPLFIQTTFWIVLSVATVVLIAILWNR
jgi:hypothetical protein